LRNSLRYRRTASAFSRARRSDGGAAELHFAEDALPLHFFLQDAKRLIDIVVTDDDLHETPLLWAKKNGPQNRSRPKES
jgi:hypothetical protein